MKTSRDPRHVHRQRIIQTLFASTFSEQEITDPKIQAILANKESLDSTIEHIAPEFPIPKLNKIDLSILRLGAYELMIEKTQPPKVIIDEAIELAKEFGGEASPGFVNGALGKLLKEQQEREATNNK
ncbi:MAG TPA: transcription antitermination factor NusB [Candidatus Levybacteria bacterium]|nr:transcription antitermination factor NusB [Candidatus Levybacteria bacterium]